MLSLGWDLGLGGIRTGKKAALLHAELPGLNVPTDFALGLYAFVAPTDVDATRKNKNCKHDTMPDHRSSETTFTFLATEIADVDCGSTSDGGGIVRAARIPVCGRERVAKFHCHGCTFL